MIIRIWQWKHDSDDGTYVSLYGSEQAALQDIYEYVLGEWDPDTYGVLPEQQSLAIELYFAANDEREWSTIVGQNVEVGDLPLAADAIDLTPEEVGVITEALMLVNFNQVSKAMELSLGKTANAIDSAYAKLKD